MTQDELYQKFLSDTAEGRVAMQARIQEKNDELARFCEPFSAAFNEATGPFRLSLEEEMKPIDRVHRERCHVVAARAHREMDVLEKERDLLLEPLKARWEEGMAPAQEAYDAGTRDRIAAVNEEVGRLIAEHEERIRPIYEAYMAEAEALEATRFLPCRPTAPQGE
jgi:hypothetical protein